MTAHLQVVVPVGREGGAAQRFVEIFGGALAGNDAQFFVIRKSRGLLERVEVGTDSCILGQSAVTIDGFFDVLDFQGADGKDLRIERMYYKNSFRVGQKKTASD